MASTQHLVDILKVELRSRGINYKQLSEMLELSESTIKHMFSSKNFSLKRLDRICELLDIEVTDLVAKLEAQEIRIEQLSLEHEKQLVSDIPLLLVAYCVTNHWSFEQILAKYQLSEPECIRCLAQLDRMKIIELQPGNRIKLLISNSFKWHDNGPIERFFRREVQQRFLSGSFSGEDELRLVKIGDLSDKSINQLIDRISNVGDQYETLSKEDCKQPFSQRYGTSMVLAIRKWEFQAFDQYLR